MPMTLLRVTPPVSSKFSNDLLQDEIGHLQVVSILSNPGMKRNVTTHSSINVVYGIVLTGHVLRRLDLSNMTHYPSPMPGKSRAYFEAISLLQKHIGAVLIN